MTHYRLHCFAQSGNAYKAALMLQLCGADWEPVFVDFFNGATRAPDWRNAVNDMGEAPVLEIGDKRLTQSGVILTYLARRFPDFTPSGEDEELEILRWILFDNHKFTSYFATLRFFRAFMPPDSYAGASAFLEGRVRSAFGVVEKHLAAREWVVGDRMTIADLSLAGYVYYPQDEHGIDIEHTYPAIDRWRKRIAAHPRWAHPYTLMPGHPRPA
jgi:glutathione S-transferase